MMKRNIMMILLIGAVLSGIYACQPRRMEKEEVQQEEVKTESKEKEEDEKEEILAIGSYFQGINGCAVFYKPSENWYGIYNEGLSEERSSPCSTFKIISTAAGFKMGVLNSTEQRMGYDGTGYPREEWNRDVTLKEAFQSSCVWYFKDVIEKIGSENMQTALNMLSYGNADISMWDGNGSNPRPKMNGFWIESCLKISPMEQVKVLEQLMETDFLTEDYKLTLENMMKVPEGKQAVYGKTGTGYNLEGQCVDGWFVGWFYKGERIYFAVRLNDTEVENSEGSKAKEIALSVIGNEFS